MGCYKSKSHNLIILASAVLLAFLGLGLSLEAIYSLPDGDDFGYFYLMKRGLEAGNSALQTATKIVDIYYCDWSGDYVSVFLVSLLNPFYFFGLRGLSLCCLIGVVLFFVSFFFFMQSLRNSMLKQARTISGVFIFVFPIAGWLDSFTPKEIFYWYTCVYSYCLGLTFLLLISSILITKEGDLYGKRKRIISLSFLFVLGLLSAGISIQNMTISIGVFVFFLIIGVVKDKWKMIFLGSGILASTMIVLLAPGNYARSISGTSIAESTGHRLIAALVDSTKCIARIGWKHILISPFFWLSLILVVILRLVSCIFKEYKLTVKTIVKRLVGSAILIYSAVLPVCYGYHISFLSPRTECVAGLIFWILILYWMIFLTSGIHPLLINESKKMILKKFMLAGVGGIFVIFFLSGENAGILAYRELASGKPQLQWENWNQIYAEVEESDEPKVIIDLDNEYITGLMTRHDEVEWDGQNVISRSYMAYCGKDEVVVNWHSDDDVYTLYGYKGPLAIDYR